MGLIRKRHGPDYLQALGRGEQPISKEGGAEAVPCWRRGARELGGVEMRGGHLAAQQPETAKGGSRGDDRAAAATGRVGGRMRDGR